MTGRPVILVVRGEDALCATLRESGCEVVQLELVKTEPVDEPGELDAVFANLGDIDGLFFTSPVAASVFLEKMRRLDRGFSGKIYVLGERAKSAFEKAGVKVEYCCDASTAEEMIDSFGEAEFTGKRFIFVRGDIGMRTIPELLRGKAQIEEVVVYRTLEKTPDPGTVDSIGKRLRSGEIDWICFFSPSGVDSFRKVFGLEGLDDVKTAAIGQTTGRKAQESGLNVDFISERAKAEDFAAGLLQHIKVIE